MTFVNPVEFGQIIRSPSAALKMFDNVLAFLGQLTDPFEKYKSGRRKGDYKLGKKGLDLFPAVKYIDKAANFESSTKESLNYLDNRRL